MTGICPACGLTVTIVNYRLEQGSELGYLGRHTRPGTRAGSKCRGSFRRWVDKNQKK